MINEIIPDRDRAIVLGRVPYGDGTHVVRVMTRELGVVALWARTGQGKNRQTAIWHPMALVELVGLSAKGTGGLYRFNEARRLHIFQKVTHDVRANAVAFFVAEVLMKTFPEGSPHSEVVDLAWQFAIDLDAADLTTTQHAHFLGDLIRVLGIQPPPRPNPEVVGDPLGLDLVHGQWVSAPGDDADHLDADAAIKFVALTASDSRHDSDAELATGELRKRILLGQVRYLQNHLSGPREILSYEVLETVFA